MDRIRGLLLALFAGVGLASMSIVALAGGADSKTPDGQERVPSAETGRELAQKLCVNCHLIGDAASDAQVGPPPFKSVANRPGQSFERIRRALIQPHAPMPDMQLTNDEIADIAAYLETLRAPDSEPLLPPPNEKMQRPKQG